jgi:hypothetical protein
MAWTAPRTWVTGEVVTASQMNTHLRDNLNSTLHRLAYKASDESVTSNTTVQDDNDLLFAIAASEIWVARFTVVVVDGSGAANFRWTLTWPAGGTGSFSSLSVNPGDLATQTRRRHVTISGNEVIAASSASTAEVLEIYGVIVNSTTAGNLLLRWAQGTSNGTAVTVKTGSNITGMKLA